MAADCETRVYENNQALCTDKTQADDGEALQSVNVDVVQGEEKRETLMGH